MENREKDYNKAFYKGIKQGLQIATKVIKGSKNKQLAIEYIENHYDFITKKHLASK